MLPKPPRKNRAGRIGARGGKSEMLKNLRQQVKAFRPATRLSAKQYDGHNAVGPDGQAFIAWGRLSDDGPLMHYVGERSDGSERRISGDKMHNAHIRLTTADVLLPFHNHYREVKQDD